MHGNTLTRTRDGRNEHTGKPLERLPEAHQDRQDFQDRQAPDTSQGTRCTGECAEFWGSQFAPNLVVIHDAISRVEQNPNSPLPWRSCLALPWRPWRASGSAEYVAGHAVHRRMRGILGFAISSESRR